MKPFEVCKKVGLSGLDELSEYSGVSVQTLNNWFKSDRQRRQFIVLALGASAVKSGGDTVSQTVEQLMAG